MPRLPQRIVCLTTETVEVLAAVPGQEARIAGISGCTVCPPRARLFRERAAAR